MIALYFCIFNHDIFFTHFGKINKICYIVYPVNTYEPTVGVNTIPYWMSWDRAEAYYFMIASVSYTFVEFDVIMLSNRLVSVLMFLKLVVVSSRVHVYRKVGHPLLAEPRDGVLGSSLV